MDDAMPVRVSQGTRHLAGNSERVGQRQLSFAREPPAQRFTLDVRHDVIEETLGLSRVDQGQDPGVIQPGRNVDLTLEALEADTRGQVGMENLDRNRSTVLQILGQVHRRHAATTDLPLQVVAVAERGLEAILKIGHEVRGPGSRDHRIGRVSE